MRALILVAAVLIPIGLSAQTPAGEQATPPASPGGYNFQGRLVQRLHDGQLVAIVPEAAFVSFGGGACQWTLQTPTDVQVKSDGTFELAIVPSESESLVSHFKSGASTGKPECIISIGWPCYRFRAAGCDDRSVLFGPKPPDSVIEFNCPGRTDTSPRRDG